MGNQKYVLPYTPVIHNFVLYHRTLTHTKIRTGIGRTNGVFRENESLGDRGGCATVAVAVANLLVETSPGIIADGRNQSGFFLSASLVLGGLVSADESSAIGGTKLRWHRRIYTT